MFGEPGHVIEDKTSRFETSRSRRLATVVRILNPLHRGGGRNTVRKRRKRTRWVAQHMDGRRDGVLRWRRRRRLVHGLRLLIALKILGHTLVFGE